MNRLIYIVIVSFVISGCASDGKGTPSNDNVSRLKKDYQDCLMRAGNDVSKCAEEKDRLQQVMPKEDWKDFTELYGS